MIDGIIGGMFMLNFDRSPRSAFAHGLIRGMAAPVHLWHEVPPPPVPQVQPLRVRHFERGQLVALSFNHALQRMTP